MQDGRRASKRHLEDLAKLLSLIKSSDVAALLSRLRDLAHADHPVNELVAKDTRYAER